MNFNTRTISTLALVTLLLLGGCMGGSNNPSTTTTTPVSDTTTPVDGPNGDSTETSTTDDATTTEEPAVTSTTTTPSGTTLSNLVDAHKAALQDAGSFAGWQHITIKDTVDQSTMRTDVRVNTTYDLVAQTANQTSHITRGDRSMTTYAYQEGDTAMNKLGGEVHRETKPYDKVIPVAVDNYAELGHTYNIKPEYAFALGTHDVHVDDVGTKMVNGQQTIKYEITGESSDLIESVNGTLLVNQQGVIVRADWQATYTRDDQQITITVHQTITDIGETAVQKPAWAKNN